MIGWLRFVGIANAACWFGATVFFTGVIGPALFSTDMLALFGGPASGPTAKYWVGSVAQVLVSRYFVLQIWCAIIGVGHLLVDWVFTGRPLQRKLLVLLVGLLAVGLVAHFRLEPEMHRLHATMYGVGDSVTVEQALKARKTFWFWHGFSQVANLAVLASVGVYLWQIARPPATPRFVSQTKFHLG